MRNLSEPIKQKLHRQAASHGRSMEAEALEIIVKGVAAVKSAPFEKLPPQERMKQALASLSGIWKDRGTTDDIMRELRGGG